MIKSPGPHQGKEEEALRVSGIREERGLRGLGIQGKIARDLL